MDEKPIRQIVKEELEPVKKDIKELKAGQEELRAGQNGMMEIIDDIAKRQDRLEERQEEMMTNIDFLVKEAQRNREEAASGFLLEKDRGKKVDALEHAVTDHEKRITKLEAAPV